MPAASASSPCDTPTALPCDSGCPPNRGRLSLLVGAHEAAVARHIGREDRGQPPFGALLVAPHPLWSPFVRRCRPSPLSSTDGPTIATPRRLTPSGASAKRSVVPGPTRSGPSNSHPVQYP